MFTFEFREQDYALVLCCFEKCPLQSVETLSLVHYYYNVGEIL